MVNLIGLLKEWARDPERVALVEKATLKMTFAELDRRSEILADYFIKTLPAGEAPVVLWGDKENDMVVGIFAALKAGRAYVSISGYYPKERTETILRLSGAAVVFTPSQNPFPVSGYTVINSELLDSIAAHAGEIHVPEENYITANETATIVFTSGSTGTPKGVMVTTGNISAMIEWRKAFDPKYGKEEIRMTNMTPYGFSSSFTNLFLFMTLRGATLWSIEPPLLSDFPSLMDRLLKINPTLMGGTPAFVEICLKSPYFNSENFPALTMFITGGEAMTFPTARKLRTAFPKARVFNIYGASELAAGGLGCEYTDVVVNEYPVLPTGYQAFNSDMTLVNESGDPVPDSEYGELLIVSDMVSLGYINDPEKTEKAFFTVPDGRRGYRTGDIMYKKDGLFYYVGRADNMVKINGNRVETEEVERAMLRNPNVDSCAVVAAEKDGKAHLLVAYVVMKKPVTEKIKTIADIKRGIMELLPHYMVPQRIIFIDKLPRNVNNKIDRKYMRAQASEGITWIEK